MKKIKKYVHLIEDELCSAEMYAEKYIEHKANGDNSVAEKFKSFALQELEHSTFIHDIAKKYIDKVSTIITVPIDMKEKWEDIHECYIEKTSRIKSIISM